MTTQTAELFTNYKGDIHEGYSGRGMYGKETTGVEFDSEKDFYKTIAEIFQDCMDDDNKTDADLTIQFLKNVRIDNMGTGVIYY